MQTYQPSSYEYNPQLNHGQQSRSRGGFLVKFFVILVIILGASGGGVLYYLNSAPEKQLDRMILALENVHSVEYDGELTYSFDSPDSVQVLKENPSLLSQILQAPFTEAANSGATFYSKFRGKYDFQDKDNPAAALALGLQMSGEPFQTTTTDAIVLSGQLVFKENILYVKVTNLPSTFGLESYPVKDTWIRVPLDSSSAYPIYGNSPIAQATESAELYKKYQSEIEKAYLKNKFLIASIKERNVVLDSQKTTHYSFSLDKVKLAGFMREIAQIYQENKLTDDEVNELVKGLDVIKNFVFDLWIGNDNHLPYKLSLKADIVAEAPSPGKASVSLDVNFKKYNESMNIVAPDDSRTFEELSVMNQDSFGDAFSAPGF